MGARVIENWADVTGTVLETRPGHTDEFLEVNLQIESTVDVEDVANLIAPLVGHTLWVNIPQELAQSLNIQVGDVVQARVRRVTATLAFVHTEHVTIHRPRAVMAPPPESPPATRSESVVEEPASDAGDASRTPINKEESTEMQNEAAPTVLAEDGFRFYFEKADLMHEQPHVHVDKGKKSAQFCLSPIGVAHAGRFTKQEIRQIEHIITENVENLINMWHAERTKSA